MRMLKTFTIAIIGSATVLPAALPAWADPAPSTIAQPAKPVPAPTPAPTSPPLTVTAKPMPADAGSRDQAMQMRREDRKAFMDARLAGLHAGLELTAQQQPLWSPVEGALRDLGKARHALRELRREDMDATARLQQRGERLVAMGQAIGKLADATGPLLGSLTPEQKGRLPMLIRGVGPHRLVKQAFGVEGGRGREGMRYGMRDGIREGERDGMRDGERDGMRDGERGWHHRHFADRDGGPDGYGRPNMDRSDMDHEGGRRRHHGWDHEGRADRDGMDGRYDREGGPSWHHRQEGDDERMGG